MPNEQDPAAPRPIEKGGYNDPTCKGNSAAHHTGKPCIERGCDAPAGTAWSPFWCFRHNVERIDRISRSLEDIAANWPKGERHA